MAVARGDLASPGQSEIERQMLARRGAEHEARILRQYESKGLQVAKMSRVIGASAEERAKAADETANAMATGADVIYQGFLQSAEWSGYPDFLIKVAGPSRFGAHHYEVVDAKLSRTTKAQAIIQVCVYTEQLGHIQDATPTHFWIVPGTEDAEPVSFRFADFAAYYRRAKADFESFVSGVGAAPDKTDDVPYPEPVEHCDVCSWWASCEKRRRDDDHLSLVAGITRRQRARLTTAAVMNTQDLAEMSPDARVDGIEAAPLVRIREQARIQVAGRAEGKVLYELLQDYESGNGLERLPPPTPGDLFLDLEGDAFAFGHGINYLFGILELRQPSFDLGPRKKAGTPRYLSYWAATPAEEKIAFEGAMRRLRDAFTEFPDMHVFHFGHRESDALKTLACRYGTCEDLVDELLRQHVLVDLHAVTKQSLRASVEGYTLKQLEALYAFERQVPKRAAAQAMQMFGWWLEVGGDDEALPGHRETIERYNDDDCRSTWRLRDWLEQRRDELAAQLQRPIARPIAPDEKSEAPGNERQEETERLARALRDGVPIPPEPNTPGYTKCLLADLLSWHWRERKSGYWEHFAAKDVPPTDRMNNRLVLDGLRYEGVVGSVKLSHVHRYRFAGDQDHILRKIPGAVDADTGKGVNVAEIGSDYVDLKRVKTSKAPHPAALIPGRPIESKAQETRLRALADSVVRFGLAASEDNNETNDWPAARALLTRTIPTFGQAPGAPLLSDDADTVAAIADLALRLRHGILAIQGPPGSGKTYRAARAIAALIKAGRKVGITANGHEVIRTLLRESVLECRRQEIPVSAQHIDEFEEGDDTTHFAIGNKHAQIRSDMDAGTLQLIGGTHFAWARAEFDNSLDVLVVDEAGQMSLANALSIAGAAHSMMLVGDPSQLDQPQKGVHPQGADVSAMEHWLGDSVTMPPERGILLRETRRLHPAICEFTSEVFYEGKLRSVDGLGQQEIFGPTPFVGAGLRFVPVPHTGNTSRSEEESEAIANMVDHLLAANATHIDHKGQQATIGPQDILVIAPYNSQVVSLRARLPQGVAVGTVDKFQGKEAAIVIYSMTTSSGDDAPRGLEFLFSLNRLNVATSRAKTLVVMVASPSLLNTRCRTPRQMKLVNALCRFVERAPEAIRHGV